MPKPAPKRPPETAKAPRGKAAAGGSAATGSRAAVGGKVAFFGVGASVAAWAMWDQRRQGLSCGTSAADVFCEIRKAGGAVHDALEMCEKEGGRRALCVARDIRDGEVLLRIPDATVLRAMFVSGEKLSEREALAGQLLAEKRRGNASRFAAHIASLPSEPLSFVALPAEIQAVLRTRYRVFAGNTPEKDLEAVRRNASLGAGDEPSREEAVWALATVDCRATASFMPDYTLALLPGHSLLRPVGGGGGPQVACEASAPRWGGPLSVACRSPPLAAGSEVLLKTDDTPTLAFLSQYGALPRERTWLRQLTPSTLTYVPEEYGCSDTAVWVPHNLTADALWAARRCQRLALLRTVSNGPEVQEFASQHGWFDVPFSSLPKAKDPVGEISGDRVWYLSVMEAKMLEMFREGVEKAWGASHDAEELDRLLAAMESARPAWAPAVGRLADTVREEVRRDVAEVERFWGILDEMRDHLAWTDAFSGAVS